MLRQHLQRPHLVPELDTVTRRSGATACPRPGDLINRHARPHVGRKVIDRAKMAGVVEQGSYVEERNPAQFLDRSDGAQVRLGELPRLRAQRLIPFAVHGVHLPKTLEDPLH